MLTKNLFVFPNAVNKRSGEETIRLDTEGKKLHFFHNDEEVVIDTDNLRDGSSTVVLSNSVTDSTYVLYNFRELLQVLDMTPSELLSNLSQRCFMQIDKSGGELFIKCFLLMGMNELPSCTDDFSGKAHYTVDYIHELDWRYSWTVKNVAAELEGDEIVISFDTVISDFWQEPVYVSHAGQTALCREGPNTVRFKYNVTENAYLGAANCRYKGRAIDLQRVLGGRNYGL